MDWAGLVFGSSCRAYPPMAGQAGEPWEEEEAEPTETCPMPVTYDLPLQQETMLLPLPGQPACRPLSLRWLERPFYLQDCLPCCSVLDFKPG